MAEENTEKVVSRRKPKDPSESKQGKNYLLVIAINEYQQCKPLRNTVKDAKDFIEILTTKYQFEKEDLITLFDEEATRKNIFRKFKELKKLIKVENKDNLIIYFSGHGEQEDNIGYWIPVEAEVGEEDEYISTNDIINLLSIIPTLHTYLIVDACFSGALFPTYKGIIETGHEKKASRWGLTASHTRELAHDGRPGENSPFAKYLLKKLLEHEEALSVPELNAYVLREVAFNTTPKQTPIGQPMGIKGHDNGHFIFHPKANEVEEWKIVLEKNNINAFRTFLNRYPNSDYLEKANWQIAILMESTEGYLDFCRKNQDSIFIEDALKRTAILQDRNYFELASIKNKLSAYEAYLNLYPFGAYRDQAKKTIDALKEIENQGIEKKYFNDDYIFIEGGMFEMGDFAKEGFKNAPVHKVTLSDYYISPFTVTFDEYDEYCEANQLEKPYDENWGRGNRPVINISWYDTLKYCNWKSEREGLEKVYSFNDKTKKVGVNWHIKGYRLPTEAEWEFAARERGQKNKFGNGKNEVQPNEINSRENNIRETVPVDMYPPNTLGLFNMSGNLFEWCWDFYGEAYYLDSKDSYNPTGPKVGNSKVIRGGNWYSQISHCQTSNRGIGIKPTRVDKGVGFRCVLSVIE